MTGRPTCYNAATLLRNTVKLSQSLTYKESHMLLTMQPPGAMSVADFCTRHDISRQTFYLLLRDGDAPQIMRVRGRTLVAEEAATAWRREMTEQTSTQRREANEQGAA